MSSTNVPVTQAPPLSADPESSIAGSTAAAMPTSDSGSALVVDSLPEAPTAGEESVAGEGPISGPDEVAAAAADVARQAAIEIAEPNTVGEHLGVTVDDGGLTMHSFRCTARGYRGWRWAVTLAHVPGSDRVTVCDTVLLPGADSIQAPAWVPWSDRLAPGDLGAGDDLPYRADDPLLVPGYTVTDEDDADQQLFWELGLGRERVVGLEGLQAAAERWERGPHGPTSELAVQASAACLSCAYLVPVSGFLRSHFGVCTNEWSPADGTVVTTDFGCGAHSETDLELPVSEPLPAHILDETIIEHVFVDRDEVDGSAEPSVEPVDGPVEPVEVESGGSAEPSVAVAAPAEVELVDGSAEPSIEPVEAQAASVAVVEPVVAVAESLVESEVAVAEPAVAVAESLVEVELVDGSAEPSVEVAESVEVVAEPAEAVAEPAAVESLGGSAEPSVEVAESVEAVAAPVVAVVEPVEVESLDGSAEPSAEAAELDQEVPEPEPEPEPASESVSVSEAASTEVPVDAAEATLESGDDAVEAVEPPKS